jgi:hypothetical protein
MPINVPVNKLFTLMLKALNMSDADFKLLIASVTFLACLSLVSIAYRAEVTAGFEAPNAKIPESPPIL